MSIIVGKTNNFKKQLKIYLKNLNNFKKIKKQKKNNNFQYKFGTFI